MVVALAETAAGPLSWCRAEVGWAPFFLRPAAPGAVLPAGWIASCLAGTYPYTLNERRYPASERDRAGRSARRRPVAAAGLRRVAPPGCAETGERTTGADTPTHGPG